MEQRRNRPQKLGVMHEAASGEKKTQVHNRSSVARRHLVVEAICHEGQDMTMFAVSGAVPIFDNQPNRKRPLWNVSDVALFLRVGERTVRDWVYRRVIPFRKAGKNLRFDPEEIEQWTPP